MKKGLVTLAAAAALAATGCGSSDGSASDAAGSGGAGGTPPSSGQASGPSLDRFYRGELFGTPKEASTPAKGKTVWVISCSQQVVSCSEPAAGVVDAAKRIGWKATVVDGKFSPPAWNGAIRQAIAAKADAIVNVAVDCGATAKSLQAAKQAGIKVGAIFSIDCDDPSVGGKPLFDAPLIMDGTKDWSAQASRWSEARARVVAAKTDGKAKVIAFRQDSLLAVKYIGEGFEKGLAACPGCKIVESVPLALTDVGPKLQQKVQSAILKHPDANVIASPYDGLTLAGLAAGVKASGQAKRLFVMGGEGYAPNIDLIRSGGGETAAMGFSSQWAGWAAVDGLNRVFDGKEPQNSGLGWQLVDADHNLPKDGPWEPPVDFRSAYAKAWGLS